MKSEWFKDWFNTQEYLTVYQQHNESDAEVHIKLILENVEIPSDAKILDMACGARNNTGKKKFSFNCCGFE